MDDGIDVVRGEDAFQRVAVEHVFLVERQAIALLEHAGAGDGAHPLDGGLAGVAQVVHYDHTVSPLQQLDARMAADEPSTARDQDAGFLVRFGKGLVGHEASRRLAFHWCGVVAPMPCRYVEEDMSPSPARSPWQLAQSPARRCCRRRCAAIMVARTVVAGIAFAFAGIAAVDARMVVAGIAAACCCSSAVAGCLSSWYQQIAAQRLFSRKGNRRKIFS